MPSKETTVPISQQALPSGHPNREGQVRSNLHVKAGGFALAGFIASNKGKIDDFYTFAQKMGEGGFGTVRKASDVRTKLECAVKSVPKKKDTAAALQEEIEVMRCLDHPHIVRLVESFQDHRCVYLVLELCEGGELLDAICDVGHLNERTAASYASQMLLACNYLHQNLIIHRDLKPQNWLLASNQHDAPLKLIDFGLAKRLSPGKRATSKVGTPNFVAPEVLQGSYGDKVDMWSLGIIIYAMLVGDLPFGGEKTQMILHQVKTASIDTRQLRHVSELCKSMVMALLSKDPHNRPSAAQALQHKWIESPPDTTHGFSVSNLKALKSFARQDKFKKAAHTAIAMQLSDVGIKNLKTAFMAMDKNQDGTISLQELHTALSGSNVSLPSEMEKQLLEQADTDGSGVIDYTEFLAATFDRKLLRQENILWAAFKKFDTDGSGTIEMHELSHVLADPDVHAVAQVGDIKVVFDTNDLNHDGVIDFEEFLRMVRGGGEKDGAK